MIFRRILTAAIVIPFACAVAQAQAEVRPRPPGTPGPDPGPPPDAARAPGGIVAMVGPDVITRAELETRVRQRRAQLSEVYPSSVVEAEIYRISYYTLEKMMDVKLVLQLVKKEEEKNEGRPYVTEADVDRTVDRQVEVTKEKSPLVRNQDDFYRMVRETQGLSREEYRKYLKDQIAYETYLRINVLTLVDSFVSPETRRVYYKTHVAEFTTPEEIAFRTILIRLGRDDAYARQKAVEKGIQEGASFEELAKKYGEEAISGDVDAAGRLWRKKFDELKSWMAPIPQTLRTLKKGQTSPAIYTARGLQYFHVEDVVEGKPKSFSEVQEEIGKRIREEREEAEVDEFMRQLRAKTYVRNLLPKPAEIGRASKKEDGEAPEATEAPPAGAGGEKKEGS